MPESLDADELGISEDESPTSNLVKLIEGIEAFLTENYKRKEVIADQVDAEEIGGGGDNRDFYLKRLLDSVMLCGLESTRKEDVINKITEELKEDEQEQMMEIVQRVMARYRKDPSKREKLPDPPGKTLEMWGEQALILEGFQIISRGVFFSDLCLRMRSVSISPAF